ncbi:hypothetical protein C2E23DRAFT_886426 [Lenzites betulinus]|nr:hypothetical protein C2E23DRAFT_886426 [Lenzites betulinus]
MSLSVPQLVNHLKGVVSSGGHRLRLRVGANGRRKRCPRISLPRVLAPLPDDISTSLVDEVHHALSALHRTDNDKVSDDAHSSHGSDFTLVGLKSGMQTPMGSEGTAADSNHVSTDLAGKLTDIGELVYSKEDFSASELALFEIKVVPKVVLPQEDYSAAEGLVPLAGYECVLEIQ